MVLALQRAQAIMHAPGKDRGFNALAHDQNLFYNAKATLSKYVRNVLQN